MILPFKSKLPVIDESVFIAEGAIIIGDVAIEKDSSVWFNAVVRGDVHFVKIGNRTNIQDGSVLHVTNGKHSLEIGNEVTIGHNAVVHGCILKNNILIGMGAVILDSAVINSNSLIAAGSLIREGFIVPEGVLAAGVPAKIKRDLTKEEINSIKESASGYVNYSKEYMKMRSKIIQ
ncbi:MAG: gamma carbonic anhydrase family protein [Ignavibacteria bacterium]|nr:gamma carbonic anhydrase family protein [Ignavibacteria bacterium]